jgi:hypothetical protein
VVGTVISVKIIKRTTKIITDRCEASKPEDKAG